MKNIKLLMFYMVFIGSGCRQEKKPWQGVFEASSSKMYGELALCNDEDSVKFQLYAMVDENMGSLEGVFYRSSDTAVFITDGCKLTFHLMNDSTVQIKNQEGYCFAGLGVYYTGIYHQTKEEFEELDIL